MPVYTKTANDVFAPYDGGGDARSPTPQDAQTWGTEVERLVASLTMSLGAAVIKGSLAELAAVAADYEDGDIGLVVVDATVMNRGIYKLSSGAWAKQAELPADVAEAAADDALEARDAAETAKADAETARDIAAGYASDAVSQGNVPIYGTIAGMAAIEVPAGINAILVNGRAAAGDGLGGRYTDSDNGSVDTFASGGATTRTWYRDNGTGRDIAVTLTVGAGGDFATINEAVVAASLMGPPRYVLAGIVGSTSSQPLIVIKLLSGFVMAEQVLVRGLNLSFIRIEAEDAETTIQRSALTQRIDTQPRIPAFGVTDGGFLPIIAALFSMDTSGTATGRDGVYASIGSRAIIEENPSAPYGVKNAGGDGCSAQRNSHIVAHQTNFSGAGENGIHAGRTSTIDASLSDVSGAAIAGLYAWRSSKINAYSTTDCSDCGSYGIYATNGGDIDALQPDCSGAGIHGIYALNGATINASQANCDNAGTDGVRAHGGSRVNVAGGHANGCGQKGLHALYTSDISAQSFNASGNIGNGIYALSATININGGNAQMGGSPAATDIVVQQGGIIRASTATGGTNVTKNIMASQGVIFG